MPQAAEFFFLAADEMDAISWRDAILNGRNSIMERLTRFGFEHSTAKDAMEREAVEAFHAIDHDGPSVLVCYEFR